MKKLMLTSTALLISAFMVVSCETKNQNETIEDVYPEDTIEVGDTIYSADAEWLQAEQDLKDAEQRLIEAKESGDEAALRAAEQAKEDAKAAWDAVKDQANRTADAVEQGTKDAVDGIKQTANEIGEAMMDLINSISDTFYIDADDIELIETDNNVFVIDPVCYIDDEQEKRINEYIKKWQSKNEKFVEALAITYFDGHNWQSEILEIDGIGNDYSDYFIIDDSEIEVDLDEAFEEMVFLKKEDWYDVYESPNHYFLKGYTPFGDYTIVEN